MHEAHDALICIKNKTYINEKNRLKFSDQHYLKNDTEMSELFADFLKHLKIIIISLFVVVLDQYFQNLFYQI